MSSSKKQTELSKTSDNSSLAVLDEKTSSKEKTINPIRKHALQYEATQKSKIQKALDTKTYNQFCDYMSNEITKSREMTEFSYRVKCFLHDGAYQLNRAVEEVYGVSITKIKDGPSQDKVFKTLDIQLSDGSRIKVPFDDISLPDMGSDAKIQMQYDRNSHEMVVFGQCETRWQSMMDSIIETTNHYLQTQSIYKDQAIELDANMEPKFINLDNIEREKLILSDVANYELRPLEARITNPMECLVKGVSLKYGCLLSGPYGELFL